MLHGMARARPRFKPALAAGFLLAATSWLPAAADEVDDALAALAEAEGGHDEIAEPGIDCFVMVGTENFEST